MKKKKKLPSIHAFGAVFISLKYYAGLNITAANTENHLFFFFCSLFVTMYRAAYALNGFSRYYSFSFYRRIDEKKISRKSRRTIEHEYTNTLCGARTYTTVHSINRNETFCIRAQTIEQTSVFGQKFNRRRRIGERLTLKTAVSRNVCAFLLKQYPPSGFCVSHVHESAKNFIYYYLCVST